MITEVIRARVAPAGGVRVSVENLELYLLSKELPHEIPPARPVEQRVNQIKTQELRMRAMRDDLPAIHVQQPHQTHRGAVTRSNSPCSVSLQEQTHRVRCRCPLLCPTAAQHWTARASRHFA